MLFLSTQTYWSLKLEMSPFVLLFYKVENRNCKISLFKNVCIIIFFFISQAKLQIIFFTIIYKKIPKTYIPKNIFYLCYRTNEIKLCKYFYNFRVWHYLNYQSPLYVYNPRKTVKSIDWARGRTLVSFSNNIAEKLVFLIIIF